MNEAGGAGMRGGAQCMWMRGGAQCMWMRGGTSKGAFFLAEHLPPNPADRDAFLLAIMGSPFATQIDGMGGADPLTSKVAVVRKSSRTDVDVDYLFLQVFVDQPIVSDSQNCGNMLAGVGPFAIERGLVAAAEGETRVAIYMENTGQTALAVVATPGRRVTYAGAARIDGVNGTAAPIPLHFRDTAGSSCGALLPTGNGVDVINDITATLIDNGMPCVVIRAIDLGITGYETRAALDADATLKSKLEAIRLLAGPLMNLGEVTEKSVPKMMLVAPPAAGGAIAVRSFIPHRCHAAIGVLGAVSVATACYVQNSPAAAVAVLPPGNPATLSVEHPSGETSCIIERDEAGTVIAAGMLRTARKLFDGTVFG